MRVRGSFTDIFSSEGETKSRCFESFSRDCGKNRVLFLRDFQIFIRVIVEIFTLFEYSNAITIADVTVRFFHRMFDGNYSKFIFQKRFFIENPAVLYCQDNQNVLLDMECQKSHTSLIFIGVLL